MSEVEMTAAQSRMAAARAARRPKADAADAFNGADPAKFDHDHDGHPGGSLPDDLVAAARAQRAAAEDAERAEARKQAAEEQRRAREIGETPRPEAIGGPTSNQRAAAKIEAEADEREEMARKRFMPVQADPTVRCRITRQGNGKISTGQHADGIGEVHYPWRDAAGAAVIINLPRSNAEALEARYFVEIEE